MAAFALLAGLIAASQALAAPGETALVSRALGPDGAKGNTESVRPSVSADGRFVAFASSATNLHPDAADLVRDIFVRDLEENTITLVSRASGANGEKGDRHSDRPSISADGRFVAFESRAATLHPDATDDVRDIFVRDLEENTTALASRASGAAGAKGDDDSGTFFGGFGGGPAISADGRFVAFASLAVNLHPDAPGASFPRLGVVFVRDLEQNTTTIASRATGPDGGAAGGSGNPSISADGRFVAFRSVGANLDPSATRPQVYVRDLEQNTTTRASRASGPEGTPGDGDSEDPAISADGRFVAFSSSATNLHPDIDLGPVQVYVHDLQESTTTLASRAWGVDGAPGDRHSFGPSISADGRFVAFESAARNFYPPVDGLTDVFVRDLEENATILASRASGPDGEKGNRASEGPSISADGRFVAFASSATNLHPDAADRLPDVFLRQLPATPPPRPVGENLPAKLEIHRAQVSDSGLVVRGSLNPKAADDHDPLQVAVSFQTRGGRAERLLWVRPNGRFATAIPRGRAGRLVVRYAGNLTLRATSQRLRAARRGVRLRIERTRLRGNRLVVAGRVAPRARGWVRVRIEFNRPDGSPAQIATRARVNERGRWRVRRRVPPAVRSLGAHVSVTHPGRGRFHGQRRGRDVGGRGAG